MVPSEDGRLKGSHRLIAIAVVVLVAILAAGLIAIVAFPNLHFLRNLLPFHAFHRLRGSL